MSRLTDSRFGPTLPEMVRRGWRSGVAVRVFLALVGGVMLVVLGLAAWNWLTRSEFSYNGSEAPAFSLDYEGFEQGKTPGAFGRFVHGDAARESEVVDIEPLRYPPGPNPIATTLPRVAAAQFGPDSPLRVVLEGRTKLGVVEGPEAYAVAYRAQGPGGYVVLGKSYFVPDGETGRGVEIVAIQQTDDRRVIRAATRYPAAFFLNWPVNFWLEAAVAVRVPERLEELLKSFSFD